ncbi:protein STRUBBELIG-RECEPTOR FAMILY 6-like isoform X2 [Iris pallida]|uniref:Protein STRUBBELIG-RECEPTOR FAMILY 6-like isoform X2 n=1 Tax=Iris pallida TaxID=29817 RepID=A0AAX6EXB7_IRIPA|nr:protein STRUBBELIG-RECEPTOR FAMILY 6-like isoform X2 [Iris pallida]KAJ6840976.1 protein STRUBBELIG-RECEPTOR FAMILY 6-like isoform X2 [Iris pallida]
MNIMTSLHELDLSNNILGGGTWIPYNLPPNLQHLNLASNSFAQANTYSISLMGSLHYLKSCSQSTIGKFGRLVGQLSSLTTM